MACIPLRSCGASAPCTPTVELVPDPSASLCIAIDPTEDHAVDECFVCMDSNGGIAAPRRGRCACKHAAVHDECLNRLVQTSQSSTCKVCKETYTGVMCRRVPYHKLTVDGRDTCVHLLAASVMPYSVVATVIAVDETGEKAWLILAAVFALLGLYGFWGLARLVCLRPRPKLWELHHGVAQVQVLPLVPLNKQTMSSVVG